MVRVEHPHDAAEKLVEEFLETQVGKRGVGDPLQVADAFRRGQRVCARVPFQRLQRQSLGAHVQAT